MNKVIAGDYVGKSISLTLGTAYLSISMLKSIQLDKSTLESFEIVNQEKRKNASSVVGRGLVGGFLLGGVGLLAGSLSAKNKGTYQVILLFKDGKKSLIECDDKVYKAITKSMF